MAEYRNRRWAQYLLWVTLVATLAFFTTRAYYRLTDDFRIANISYDMPYQSQWQIDPLSPSDAAAFHKIFEQPFHYIGKGAQSYAFISEDGKFVIKFFKFKHLKPNWLVETLPDFSFLKEYKDKNIARKQRLIRSVFDGYKLAYDLHKDESGLIFIHLNKTSDLNKEIVLYDKIVRQHRLDLDSTVFVLQNYAVTTREVIKQALDAENLGLAKKKLDQIIELYLLEYSRGIYDRDHGWMHNTGFVAETPIHLDVGKLSKDENMKQDEYKILDLQKLGLRFQEWLKSNYPAHEKELMQHIWHKMSAEIGQSVEVSIQDTQ